MSFLSTRDLSSLMRTCHYFLDACLRPLCARSGDLLRDVHLTGIPSFHRFLRINAGPSSRSHLIRHLWIAVTDTLYQFNKLCGNESVLPERKQWSVALLDILHHCHNLRRLRIDLWFNEDIPFPRFVETITSLQHLEDLTLYLPHRLQDDEVNTLRSLARLPLRRLAFLKFSEICPSLLHAPIPLEDLPRSLVELDIDVCMPVSRPFPMVRTLGVRVPTSDTFVADATTAFPNVTQLILRRHVDKDVFASVYRGPGPIFQRAWAHNKIQWQLSEHRDAWPSLSAIWVVDLCMLYAARFSRQVSSTSLPFRKEGEEAYLASVLADTSPRFLELRVDIDDFPPLPPADWQSHLGPWASSVRRVKFLLERYKRNCPWDDDLVKARFDDVCAILPAFTSLTHMFLELVPTEEAYQAVEAAMQEYLPRFSRACGSLRWVAFNVFDLGLECWEISPGGEPSRAEGQSLCTKTSREAARAVLNSEGMDTFRDARQCLNAVWTRDEVGMDSELESKSDSEASNTATSTEDAD